MALIKPIRSINAINPIQPVNPIKPLRTIQPISLLQKQQKGQSQSDPYAINSITDTLFNRQAQIRKYGTYDLSTVVRSGVYHLNNSFVKPFIKGDMVTVGVNSLRAFAEDADVLANVAKGAIIEGDNEALSYIVAGVAGLVAGAATVATGGTFGIAMAAGVVVGGMSGVGASILEDPEAALRGIEKGTGLGRFGKTQYDFDMGNFFLNMAGEVVMDPLNWLSFGSAAVVKSASIAARKAGEAVAETAAKLTMNNSMLHLVEKLGNFDNVVTKIAFLGNPLGASLYGIKHASPLISAISSRFAHTMAEFTDKSNMLDALGYNQAIEVGVREARNYVAETRKNYANELMIMPGKDANISQWYRLVKKGMNKTFGVEFSQASEQLDEMIIGYLKGDPDYLAKHLTDKNKAFLETAFASFRATSGAEFGAAKGYFITNYKKGLDAIQVYVQRLNEGAMSRILFDESMDKGFQELSETINKELGGKRGNIFEYISGVRRGVFSRFPELKGMPKEQAKAKYGSLLTQIEAMYLAPSGATLDDLFEVMAKTDKELNLHGINHPGGPLVRGTFADITDDGSKLLLDKKQMVEGVRSFMDGTKAVTKSEELFEKVSIPGFRKKSVWEEAERLVQRNLNTPRAYEWKKRFELERFSTFKGKVLEINNKLNNAEDITKAAKAKATEEVEAYIAKHVVPEQVGYFKTIFIAYARVYDVVTNGIKRSTDVKKYKKALASFIQLYKVASSTDFSDLKGYITSGEDSEFYKMFSEINGVVADLGILEDTVVHLNKEGSILLQLNKRFQTEFMRNTLLDSPMVTLFNELVDTTRPLGMLMQAISSYNFTEEFAGLGKQATELWTNIKGFENYVELSNRLHTTVTEKISYRPAEMTILNMKHAAWVVDDNADRIVYRVLWDNPESTDAADAYYTFMKDEVGTETRQVVDLDELKLITDEEFIEDMKELEQLKALHKQNIDNFNAPKAVMSDIEIEIKTTPQSIMLKDNLIKEANMARTNELTNIMGVDVVHADLIQKVFKIVPVSQEAVIQYGHTTSKGNLLVRNLYNYVFKEGKATDDNTFGLNIARLGEKVWFNDLVSYFQFRRVEHTLGNIEFNAPALAKQWLAHYADYEDKDQAYEYFIRKYMNRKFGRTFELQELMADDDLYNEVTTHMLKHFTSSPDKISTLMTYTDRELMQNMGMEDGMYNTYVKPARDLAAAMFDGYSPVYVMDTIRNLSTEDYARLVQGAEIPGVPREFGVFLSQTSHNVEDVFRPPMILDINRLSSYMNIYGLDYKDITTRIFSMFNAVDDGYNVLLINGKWSSYFGDVKGNYTPSKAESLTDKITKFISKINEGNKGKGAIKLNDGEYVNNAELDMYRDADRANAKAISGKIVGNQAIGDDGTTFVRMRVLNASAPYDQSVSFDFKNIAVGSKKQINEALGNLNTIQNIQADSFTDDLAKQLHLETLAFNKEPIDGFSSYVGAPKHHQFLSNFYDLGKGNDVVINGVHFKNSEAAYQASKFYDVPLGYQGSYTPSKVELGTNQVFVFGSNTHGEHGAGAAKDAKELYGAIEGQGRGLQGRSYGIPTRYKNEQGYFRTLSLPQISQEIDQFIADVSNDLTQTYIVTEVGAGLAGLKYEDISALFRSKTFPKNVILPYNYTVDSGLARKTVGEYTGKGLYDVSTTTKGDAVTIIGSRGYKIPGQDPKTTRDFPEYARERLNIVQDIVNGKEVITRSGGAIGADDVVTKAVSKRDTFEYKAPGFFTLNTSNIRESIVGEEALRITKMLTGELPERQLKRFAKYVQLLEQTRVVNPSELPKAIEYSFNPNFPKEGEGEFLKKLAEYYNIPAYNSYNPDEAAVLEQLEQLHRVPSNIGSTNRSIQGKYVIKDPPKVDKVPPQKEIYTPSYYLYEHVADADRIIAPNLPNFAEATKIAREIIGPRFDKFSPYVQKLHARNVYQVLGSNLQSPTKFIAYWRDPFSDLGGTETALLLARKYKIPAFNVYYADEFETLINTLGSTHPIPLPGGASIPTSVRPPVNMGKKGTKTIWQEFAGMDAAAAKKYSKDPDVRAFTLPGMRDKDTKNEFRMSIMKRAVDAKFQNPILQQRLLATGSRDLIERNTWGDTFWGIADGVGDNRLGQLLMDKRKELVEGISTVENVKENPKLQGLYNPEDIQARAALTNMSPEEYSMMKRQGNGFKFADGRVELYKNKGFTDMKPVTAQTLVEERISDPENQNMLQGMVLEMLEEFRVKPVAEAMELLENGGEKFFARFQLAPQMAAYEDVMRKMYLILQDYLKRQEGISDFSVKTIEMPNYDIGLKIQTFLEDELPAYVKSMNDEGMQKDMYTQQIENLKDTFLKVKTEDDIATQFHRVAGALAEAPQKIDALNRIAHQYFIRPLDAGSAKRATATLMSTGSLVGAIGLDKEASPYSGIISRYVNTYMRSIIEKYPDMKDQLTALSKDELREFIYKYDPEGMEGLAGELVHDKFKAALNTQAAYENQLNLIGSSTRIQDNVERLLLQSQGRQDEILTPVERYMDAKREIYSQLGTLNPDLKDALYNYQMHGAEMIQASKDILEHTVMDPKSTGYFGTYKGYTQAPRNTVSLLQRLANPDSPESMEQLARLLKFHSIGEMVFVSKGMHLDLDPRVVATLDTLYGIKYLDKGAHIMLDMRKTTDVLNKMSPITGHFTRTANTDDMSEAFIEKMSRFYYTMQESSKRTFPIDWADSLIMRIDDAKVVPYLRDVLKYLSPEESIAYSSAIQDSGMFGLSFLTEVEELSGIFGGRLMESPAKMAISSGVSLMLHHDAKPRFLNLFFNENFQLNTFFESDDPKLIYDVIRHNRDLAVMGLDKHMNAKQIPINSIRDVETAIRKKAIITTHRGFVRTYNALNTFKMPKLLDFIERNFTAPFKSGAMSSLGLPFRNLMDNNIKLLMYANGDLDVYSYIPKAYAVMGRFQEMALEMKNIQDPRAVAEYLLRQTPEDQQTFFLMVQAKEGAVSGAPMDVYLDLSKAERAAAELRSGKTDPSSLIQKISWGNPITQFALALQNSSEQHWRLAAYLYDMERGVSASETMHRVAEFFIDYSHKTPTMQYLNAIVPFSMFTVKNTLLWAEHALDTPWLLRTIVDASDKTWVDSEQEAKYDSTRNYYKQQRMAGNMKLGTTLVKMNPSLYDAMMLIPGLIKDPIGRVNPVIKNLGALMSGDMSQIQLPWETQAARAAKAVKTVPQMMRGNAPVLPTLVPSAFSELKQYDSRGTEYKPSGKYIFNSVYYAAQMSRKRGGALSSNRIRRNFYNSIWSKSGKPRFVNPSIQARISNINYRYKEINKGRY